MQKRQTARGLKLNSQIATQSEECDSQYFNMDRWGISSFINFILTNHLLLRQYLPENLT